MQLIIILLTIRLVTSSEPCFDMGNYWCYNNQCLSAVLTTHGYNCLGSGHAIPARCPENAICENDRYTCNPGYRSVWNNPGGWGSNCDNCKLDHRCVDATIITTSPTGMPTNIPTGIPTSIPTGIPTSIETYEPVSEPINSPTYIPTGIPTRVPSGIPTSIETYQPVSEPTNSPTYIPTRIPTRVPTGIPTSKSTENGYSDEEYDDNVESKYSLTDIYLIVILVLLLVLILVIYKLLSQCIEKCRQEYDLPIITTGTNIPPTITNVHVYQGTHIPDGLPDVYAHAITPSAPSIEDKV